jgi:hypothetical protein
VKRVVATRWRQNFFSTVRLRFLSHGCGIRPSGTQDSQCLPPTQRQSYGLCV